MITQNRNWKPMWFLRVKIIFLSIVITNIIMSFSTKCFANGISNCINPEYTGQHYLWSAGGFVIGMIIMFAYDCFTLESNGESEGM